MNHTEDLILLNTIEELGFKRLEGLLSAFKDTPGILKAKKYELTAVNSINNELAEKISALDREKVSGELRTAEKLGVRVVTIFDDEYPENLKNIYSPPILFYIKGEIRTEDVDAVGIVGTRRPSHYGTSTCERLASGLASIGITVVSGLARGIDTMAHKGALKSGRTIAVLGSGLNYVYPPENRKLAEEVCERGAVISEFPLDTPPYKSNFPRRNRIISGLSLGVVVVEASEKSGSLITANFALNENRELFAVPGQAGSKRSTGSNNLIREGAKLVEDIDDIIVEIETNLRYKKISREKKPDINSARALTGDEKIITDFLGNEPLYIDELAKKSNMNVSKVSTLLLALEFKNVAKELPGKNFILR